MGGQTCLACRASDIPRLWQATGTTKLAPHKKKMPLKRHRGFYGGYFRSAIVGIFSKSLLARTWDVILHFWGVLVERADDPRNKFVICVHFLHLEMHSLQKKVQSPRIADQK
jgi:hypothetical protein